MKLEIPTYVDLLQATARLEGHALKTPVLQNQKLNAICGYNLFLKNETAQKTGTFKYRGAYSRLSAMTTDERDRGVVAFSSGNHAQGVALAAKELGISATIVMPTTAPKKKKQGTLSHGAKIVEYDPLRKDREVIAHDISRTENRIVVPSYDDPYIVSGQGSCGLEFANQCADMGVDLDAVITPIGGGGLCAGLTLSFRELSPRTKIYGAEPYHYDDHVRSLKSGRREINKHHIPSLCDALLSPSPGRITFAINKHSLDAVFPVLDDEALLTMAVMHENTGVVLEPGGATALAAVLSSQLKAEKGANIGVILSGGNVDPKVFALADQAKAEFLVGPAG
ncbi:MAG: threonine/serine dehydratase [Acidimicrobiales bacterium]|nr:threonine/serine dehydratase [Hyphomonadaceae bacterium]RZV41081.1 MAG: threonine/serine dehydratase [Acidimicrobiales bacterium]